MKPKSAQQLKRKIRNTISLFIVLLVLSGISAFPLETELSVLTSASKNAPIFFNNWINRVYEAVKQTNCNYPFMAYGTDWLAFAHLVIAVAFIGPLKDPVKNSWVIQFGMIACLMVFPLAFTCGWIRGIPFYWQLIDCLFGVVGLIPLYICYRDIIKLEQTILKNNL